MRIEYYKMPETLSDSYIRECVVRNGGIIASFGYGFTLPTEGQVYPGWEVVSVDCRGMGNHGTMVFRGTTAETRALQNACIVRQLEALFSPEQCWKSWIAGENLSEANLLIGLFYGKSLILHGQFRAKWHTNQNYVNVGNDTYRVWVSPV